MPPKDDKMASDVGMGVLFGYRFFDGASFAQDEAQTKAKMHLYIFAECSAVNYSRIR